MLSNCTEHGADQEYFEDADANTALHIVLKEVWNYNEYLAEAERLGLTVQSHISLPPPTCTLPAAGCLHPLKDCTLEGMREIISCTLWG